VIQRLTEIFGSSSGWFELGVGLPPRPPERTAEIAEIESHLISAKARDLRDLRGQRTWGVPSTLLARSGVDGGSLVVVYAPEDVAPDIRRGDHVIVDLSRTKAADAIFFVLDDGRASFARLAPRGRQKQTILGQAVGVFRMLLVEAE
jgi:hypothetical protein